MKTVFKLDEILKERNISRRELSRMTGIRPQTINDMCNNTAIHLPLENTAKICKALDCDITDILKLEREQPE